MPQGGDSFWDSEELIGFVEKSATERIAVRRVSKGTRQYVDVRVEWRRADEESEFLPSKKGVVIAWDAVEDVMALMKEALETGGREKKRR